MNYVTLTESFIEIMENNWIKIKEISYNCQLNHRYCENL